MFCIVLVSSTTIFVSLLVFSFYVFCVFRFLLLFSLFLFFVFFPFFSSHCRTALSLLEFYAFGACFWEHKTPLREWGHALPRLSLQKHGFLLQINPRACFWGRKETLREWGHALPGFGQVPVSNPVPPGCVVRVPAHWAI